MAVSYAGSRSLASVGCDLVARTRVPGFEPVGASRRERCSVAIHLDRSDKKSCLFKTRIVSYLRPMSTVKEIEAAIPKLSRAEVEQIRDWIEDYLDDQMELTDEVKAKLDQSRREIAAGQFTTHRPH